MNHVEVHPLAAGLDVFNVWCEAQVGFEIVVVFPLPCQSFYGRFAVRGHGLPNSISYAAICLEKKSRAASEREFRAVTKMGKARNFAYFHQFWQDDKTTRTQRT